MENNFGYCLFSLSDLRQKFHFNLVSDVIWKEGGKEQGKLEIQAEKEEEE